jgi:hypothetical protein
MKTATDRIIEAVIRALRGCNRYSAELPSGTREVVRLSEAEGAVRAVGRRARIKAARTKSVRTMRSR